MKKYYFLFFIYFILVFTVHSEDNRIGILFGKYSVIELKKKDISVDEFIIYGIEKYTDDTYNYAYFMDIWKNNTTENKNQDFLLGFYIIPDNNAIMVEISSDNGQFVCIFTKDENINSIYSNLFDSYISLNKARKIPYNKSNINNRNMIKSIIYTMLLSIL